MPSTHTELPAAPDEWAHLCALENAARDTGVCADLPDPLKQNPYLDDLVRQACRWGMSD